MTYKEKFDNCRTFGEARRLRAMLMDETSSNEETARAEIKRAYEERKNEIRKSWEEHCFG